MPFAPVSGCPEFVPSNWDFDDLEEVQVWTCSPHFYSSRN